MYKRGLNPREIFDILWSDRSNYRDYLEVYNEIKHIVLIDYYNMEVQIY